MYELHFPLLANVFLFCSFRSNVRFVPGSRTIYRWWKVKVNSSTEFIQFFLSPLLSTRGCWWFIVSSNIYLVYTFSYLLAEKNTKCVRLTRENRPRHGTCTAFALDDYVFDAPFVVLSSDCDQTAIAPTSADPIDEWFANSSNCILSPEWIRPCCDDIDHMDAPANIIVKYFRFGFDAFIDSIQFNLFYLFLSKILCESVVKVEITFLYARIEKSSSNVRIYKLPTFDKLRKNTILSISIIYDTLQLQNRETLWMNSESIDKFVSEHQPKSILLDSMLETEPKNHMKSIGDTTKWSLVFRVHPYKVAQNWGGKLTMSCCGILFNVMVDGPWRHKVSRLSTIHSHWNGM